MKARCKSETPEDIYKRGFEAGRRYEREKRRAGQGARLEAAYMGEYDERTTDTAGDSGEVEETA